MRIEAYLTPYFPEEEDLFENSIVIMIDVLRASTTVCTALHNGAKEVIAADSLEKAVRIYASLSRESRFLGGERNGIKPDGFDAGNSPFEYSKEAVEDKTVIITTTNGTLIFQKGKSASVRIVGGFVNHSAVSDFINDYASANAVKKITILCAGNNGNVSYEDTLCAGAYIKAANVMFGEVYLTDTAEAAQNLFMLHSQNLKEYINTREHAKILCDLGFQDDIDYALKFDVCPVIPIITGSGNSINNYKKTN